MPCNMFRYSSLKLSQLRAVEKMLIITKRSSLTKILIKFTPFSYRLGYWTRDHDTQYIYTQHIDTHHNDSQHDNKKIPTFSIMTLIIIALYIMSFYTKYHLCYMMFVLSVKNKLFMLRVVMLNVVAPFTHCRQKLRLETATISSV
jgi:hypothetical protein